MLCMYDVVTRMCTLYGVVPVELTSIPDSKPDVLRTQIWKSHTPCNGDQNADNSISTLATGESFQMIRESGQSIKLSPIV
ncbi:hypothetical protein CAEBREN_24651 [Caenorhabditis brenneri]|uniref:Uncharacterized protein n=1 Tax=Caenorhabditis brenneri TaxID=135651 RepID=G0NMB7_CAEBE|nr:hypothetical protein CAEBREN_24651 [Caenorhabditis brenneri]